MIALALLAALCIPSEPLVMLAPPSQRAASPGCALEATLIVTNQDSPECAPRPFVLAVNVGEGLARAVVDNSYVTLAPGERVQVEADIAAVEPTYGYLIGSASRPWALFHHGLTTYAPETPVYAFVDGCGCDAPYTVQP